MTKKLPVPRRGRKPVPAPAHVLERIPGISRAVLQIRGERGLCCCYWLQQVPCPWGDGWAVFD